jgi:hypothetical protein
MTGLRALLVGGAIAGALGVAAEPAARADVMMIEFPSDIDAADGSAMTGFLNATAKGFRISPTHHFDDEVVIGSTSYPGLGWDGMTSNPDYLGPSVGPLTSAVVVDRDGALFDLLDVEAIYAYALRITSSNGGMFIAPTPSSGTPTEFDFSGPDWTDISWLLFSYDNNPGAPITGFDRLTVAAEALVAIAEPAGLSVIAAAAIAGLALARRKRANSV